MDLCYQENDNSNDLLKEKRRKHFSIWRMHMAMTKEDGVAVMLEPLAEEELAQKKQEDNDWLRKH